MNMLSIAKKLLPDWFKLKVLKLQAQAREYLMALCSRSGFSASVYYLLFSREFDREHRAVLCAKLKHKKAITQAHRSHFLLRRNTHRLEKGLIMRPQRKRFAEDYIVETVEIYARCAKSGTLCLDELTWANNVLKAYFSVVEHSPTIEQAEQIFARCQAISTEQISSTKAVPYPQKALLQPDVSYAQFLQLVKCRRSTRWFKQIPVATCLIDDAVHAASFAPSACNRQPFRFHIETQAENVLSLAKCALGSAGFAENIPAIIAVLGDLSAFPTERDRHVIYIDGALAAMQLMLALETKGLSSCPLNQPDIEAYEVNLANLLSLPFFERPVMLIAVGYADPEGGIAYSQKKSCDILTRR